jgi:hypothetical protein
MLDLLDKLDNLLARPVREALAGRNSNNIESFPVSEDELNMVIAAKKLYRETNYGVEEVRVYLLRLPEVDEIWGNVCRGILRLSRHDPTRLGTGEWHLFLKQVERCGTFAWQKAFNASVPITKTYPQWCGTMVRALVQKFAIVDELLDEMYPMLERGRRETQFSTELDDSL